MVLDVFLGGKPFHLAAYGFGCYSIATRDTLASFTSRSKGIQEKCSNQWGAFSVEDTLILGKDQRG